MAPVQHPAGLGVEPAFLSDLTLVPTTPTLVPVPLNNSASQVNEITHFFMPFRNKLGFTNNSCLGI
jgi:hypothetical protein